MDDIKIKDKKMSDTFEVRGIWSKSIDELEKGVSGVLKYSPEKITLELLGELTTDIDNHFDGCIYGFTVRGEYVTLYDCFRSGTESNFPGIQTELYIVNRLLVGGLHREDEILFKNSYVYFSNLVEWLGKSIVNHNVDGNMKHTYEVDKDKIKSDLINIKIPSIGLNIQEGYTITHRSHIDKIDVISDRYFKFATDNTASLKIQLENIQKIRKLISFLIKGPIHIERIEIVPSELKDYEGKLYDKRHTYLYFAIQTVNKKILKWHEQLFTYNDISENIEDIFNKWIEGYENIGECYDLISTDMHKSEYDENVFLDCARAIEAFHRNIMEDVLKPAKDSNIELYCEAIKSYIYDNIPEEEYREYFIDRITYEGETTFAKRITHIFECIDTDISKDIIKQRNKNLKRSISSFSTKVSKTRNYLTHKDYKKYDDPAVIKDPVKQLVTTYQMKMIVIILIGSYIGIDEIKLFEHLSRSNLYHTMKMYT